MTDLDQFPADIYQTMIALPYRVGLYVSNSDSTGGKDSEARELAALENVVTFYVEDTLKSEFSQSIMLVTLQHKAYWKDWAHNIENVPDECRKIAEYLATTIEARDLMSFKANLLEISMAVAMAYREEVEPVGFVAKIKNLFAPKTEIADPNTTLNISEAEKTAINQLAEAMGVGERVS